MTNTQMRGLVTMVLWVTYLGMVVFAMQSLGVWAALIAFVLMIPLIITMGAMWNVFDSDSSSKHQHDGETEKRKREHLDTVLRNLSDDDLIMLRQRLQDGSIDDELLHKQLLGDDGEFKAFVDEI